MSLAIDDSIRGTVKIKTFDEGTLKDPKRRHSLEKVSDFISSCIIDSCQITGGGEKKRQVCRAIMCNWTDRADSFLEGSGRTGELYQVAKIGKVVQGASLLSREESWELCIAQLFVTPPNLSLHPSRIGTILVAAACLEVKQRACTKLNLISADEAVGFYRGLNMQETVNLCQITEFSLDLHQPLPVKLNETVSQIHPHNKSNRS